MEEFLIPNIVLIGYGRSQNYQCKCLKCKTQYFPSRKVKVFCEDCSELPISKLNKYIKDENRSSVKYLGNIVGWENRVTARDRRSRHNYRKTYDRDGYICQYCRYNPRTYDEFYPLWIDHIIPHSYGGGHSMNNLVVSCQPCNLLVSNKVFPDFEAKKLYILQQRIQKGLYVDDWLRSVYDLNK